ncbi:MAG: cation:proton antiporter [Aquificaceae bacterium]|nr:MAG: cation:proton antiporter [Aquificaceae bacterium]
MALFYSGLVLFLIYLSILLSRRFGVPSLIPIIFLGLLTKDFIHAEHLQFFVELGLILLFFFIGLEFNFEKLKSMTAKSWKAGIADFVINFFPPLGLSLLFGFNFIEALFIATVAYPSSTSIIAKLLIDYKRLINPETELILGVLIFEDIVAIILLSVLFGITKGNVNPTDIALNILLMFAVVVLSAILGRFVLSKITNYLEKILTGAEDVILLMLGLLLLVAGGFHSLGISEVLGAFILGLMFGETPFAEDIEKSLHDLKELSMAIFFYNFGASIPEITQMPNILFLTLLAVVSIIGKIISTYIGGLIAGFSPKLSLRASLEMVPRGEFSIVVTAMAPKALQPLSAIYIITTAVIGSVIFIYAPQAVNKIFGKKKKSKDEVPNYLKDLVK